MDSEATNADLKPSDGVRNINTQDGAVLLDIDQGLCFSMNPVGARIWEMLKMNHSIDNIADVLASEYSIAREQVLEDVQEFLAQLQNQNLLVSNRETKKNMGGLFQRFFRRIHGPK